MRTLGGAGISVSVVMSPLNASAAGSFATSALVSSVGTESCAHETPSLQKKYFFAPSDPSTPNASR